MPIDLGSGVLYEASTTGSGTGNYDSFLRLAANGDEEGFNTDDNNEADNKNGVWTHSLLVGSLQSVTIGSDEYYIIRLDLNEVQSGDNPNIDLEELRIFRSTDPADGDDFDNDFSGLTEVFDLASTLNLVDTNHGSGTDDYVFYIPVSLFPDPSEYFTLYADFSGSDDGFEEFRALSTVFTPQPDIGILKETNDTDDQCGNILTGATVTWTYTVENNGNLPLSNVLVTDDNGTPLDTSDDFHPVYVSGDTDGDSKLDTTETWTFSANGTAGIGEYTNIATVVGDWAFGEGSGTVTSSEEDCYFGANPDLSILKLTNGIDNLCPVVAVGENVTWSYYVTNTGNVALDVVVTDDNGTVGDTSDDFHPDQVLSGAFNVGDINTDGIFDPGEIWQYTATGTVIAGHYENTATAAADFTDDFSNSTTVTVTETDCYVGVEGCVRTPGFWQNMRNGGQFWDGVVGNEKHAGEEHFPTGELLYAVDSNHNGSVGAGDVAGLLIGDYNKNGIADLGLDGLPNTGDAGEEDTIFISYSNARALINANNAQMSDGVVKIGRDVVATWLNYLSGAAIGDASDDGSPHHFIDDAIDYLQIFGDSNIAGNTNTNDVFDTYASNHGKVKTSSGFWNNDFPGGDHSGSEIHSALDGYNNTGAINGIAYAASCDNPQLLEQLNGFSMAGAIYLV